MLLPVNVDLTFTFFFLVFGKGVIWTTHMMRRRRETETHFYGSHFRGGREGRKTDNVMETGPREIKPILFSPAESHLKKRRKRMSKEGFYCCFAAFMGGTRERGKEVYSRKNCNKCISQRKGKRNKTAIFFAMIHKTFVSPIIFPISYFKNLLFFCFSTFTQLYQLFY